MLSRSLRDSFLGDYMIVSMFIGGESEWFIERLILGYEVYVFSL